MNKPQAGDTGFSNGDSILNQLTKYFTEIRGEPKTKATHQWKFVNGLNTVHATAKGVVQIPWIDCMVDMKERGQEWAVYQPPRPYTARQTTLMQGALLQMVGEGWQYSRAELVLCMLDGILSKWLGQEMIVFRRIDLFRTRVICSKTANRADIKAGALPNIAYYWTPDDTCDWMERLWVRRVASPGWEPDKPIEGI